MTTSPAPTWLRVTHSIRSAAPSSLLRALRMPSGPATRLVRAPPRPARSRRAFLALKSDPASTRLAVKHLFTGVYVPVRVTSGRVVEPVRPQGVLGGTTEKRCSHHPRRDLHRALLDRYRSFSQHDSPRAGTAGQRCSPVPLTWAVVVTGIPLQYGRVRYRLAVQVGWHSEFIPRRGSSSEEALWHSITSGRSTTWGTGAGSRRCDGGARYRSRVSRRGKLSSGTSRSGRRVRGLTRFHCGLPTRARVRSTSSCCRVGRDRCGTVTTGRAGVGSSAAAVRALVGGWAVHMTAVCGQEWGGHGGGGRGRRGRYPRGRPGRDRRAGRVRPLPGV